MCDMHHDNTDRKDAFIFFSNTDLGKMSLKYSGPYVWNKLLHLHTTQTLLKPHLSGHWKFASKMEAEQCVGGNQYWIPYVYKCPRAAIYVNYVTIIYTPLISMIASFVVRHNLLCNAPYIMFGNNYCHNATIRVSDKILTKIIFGVTIILLIRIPIANDGIICDDELFHDFGAI